MFEFVPSKARGIRNVKLGQKFETRGLEPEYGHNDKWIPIVRKWVVTEVYPFFIKARAHVGDGVFKTECFNLGELVQLGLEPKGGVD